MGLPTTEPADDHADQAAWMDLLDLYQLPSASPEHRRVLPIDICIRESHSKPVKKITRIVPYADGGFAVISPYLPRVEGLAVKYQRDYRVILSTTQWAKSFKYQASDRLKLSLHPDGFAQFSGEYQGRIVSGRDHTTGEPKGVGVLASPFATPVYSGPTFGVQVWGLDDYPEWTARSNSHSVVFDPDDVYFNDADLGTYVIEGFLFIAPWFLPHVRFDRHESSARRATIPLWRYHIRGSRQWDFTLLPGIAAPHVLVAVRVSKFPFRFASPSGFVLHGPAERGVGQIRWIISAFCPPPDGGIKADASLDYLGGSAAQTRAGESC